MRTALVALALLVIAGCGDSTGVAVERREDWERVAEVNARLATATMEDRRVLEKIADGSEHALADGAMGMVTMSACSDAVYYAAMLNATAIILIGIAAKSPSAGNVTAAALASAEATRATWVMITTCELPEAPGMPGGPGTGWM